MNREKDVIIRPFTMLDDEPVYEAVRESLQDLLPWMPWCHSDYDISDTRDWLVLQIWAFLKGTAFEFAITSGNGSLLGVCGLNQIDEANRSANLGYWIRSGAKGRGIATEAVRLIRDWGFENTSLLRMELVIAVENHASLRVADKAGARREGISHNGLLLQGAPHDAVIFSFLRPGGP